jgi:hypothetical protein
VDEEVPGDVDHPPRIDAALMISFGTVIPGRERLAVDSFTEVSRYLGDLLADDAITGFQPFFFADGQVGGTSGFFILEGRRERLDMLRRDEGFNKLVLRAGAATQNVHVHTLIAGSEAGRLVNRYREIRGDLGLL